MAITHVGILLFDEVEVLDFAGPFEVFSITENNGQKLFSVTTVSEKGKLIHARNGLKVQPDWSIRTAPEFDILIIPGGYGAEAIEINNQVLINWIQNQAHATRLIASVCTGAFLLAKAELLIGKTATTHWMDIDKLQKDFPELTVKKGVKYVDEGNIITSGGISAGISMSLYIVERYFSTTIAIQTAKRMEYDWKL
ncbi:DJ-1/PfpI family protein [Aquibacillus rhizosphaerae]|uniref:DJ-1/PfpI family protein n=1 Tax=Aquibacillus rhizosphaerae TaxID=3051431 RepID=A0ABT7L3E8_9BACI|nr:DJ-1/PfpI family protein [Aquibacillus sp. LR5S19]MDL4840390.1 DJ-1/PfpI family protein [Aquibacillus sp. LR5S19]